MDQNHITDITGQVKKLEVNQRGGGSSGDVFYGEWKSPQGHIRVAIKTMRIYTDDRVEIATISQKFMREARVWSRLRHENIVPFCGVASDLALRPGIPSVISPWYDNGSLHAYYKLHWKEGKGIAPERRREIMIGVLKGIEYLHTRSPPVVHGDLSMTNVFIDGHGKPCLADFGLSLFVGVPGFTTVNNRGTQKYMAVELFDDGPGGPGTVPKKTKESDIWAFGILTLEILSYIEPYLSSSGRPLGEAALVHLVKTKKGRPDHNTYRNRIDDNLWGMCLSCWRTNPKDRFTATEISDNLSQRR